jgi:hypothetical protein
VTAISQLPTDWIQDIATAMNLLRRPRSYLLLALLSAATISLLLAPFGRAGRWLSTAGLLFDLAGVVQLYISGLIEAWLNRFADTTKYPGGPPSHVTRWLSEEKTPLAILNDRLFVDVRIGFYLIFLGGALQIAGVWLDGG